MARNRQTVQVRLRKGRFKRLTTQETRQNLGMATIYLRDQVKKKLNRGQPTRTTAGGNVIGLSPSAPGTPPKKITGIYQNSIRATTVRVGSEIIGLVGTDQKRAPALELGNSKGTLKPRPHFRPALRESRRKLLQIVAKGRGAF